LPQTQGAKRKRKSPQGGQGSHTEKSGKLSRAVTQGAHEHRGPVPRRGTGLWESLRLPRTTASSPTSRRTGAWVFSFNYSLTPDHPAGGGGGLPRLNPSEGKTWDGDGRGRVMKGEARQGEERGTSQKESFLLAGNLGTLLARV